MNMLTQARVFVLAGPRDKFTETEINNLKKYLELGGSILVMLGDGGEKRFGTNINFLLEECGIMVNNDSVVRTNFYKYFHPKECLIQNGVLNRAVTEIAGKGLSGLMLDDNLDSQAISFLYAYGATLNVARPAVAVLSTGSVSFPQERPVLALYSHPGGGGGKLAVLGSSAMLTDQFIDKEDNSKVKDIVFSFLTSDEFELNKMDAEDPEISDYIMIPDTAWLADTPRVCLQESEDIPSDYTRLFKSNLYSVHTSMVPKVINTFKDLGVKHDPLKLITPQFETPLPPLQAAVFPPQFRNLPDPQLELFDLDEAFSSDKSRLAQVTNKCGEEDLEYYIRECGEILGVNPKLPQGAQDAKHILEFVFAHIVEFKKINHAFDEEHFD
ncbi:intraflagellar transport protein 52 homolog isoform X2 [Eurytemora carolleeae]|nr:intraflagellar transport protein 52 homolog isoform X2 [Eurytemora carolleeae]|eukprot:XP_023333653.1 intraflagellar transport protein 52 homolog isoform X2 [Eurytemora affinis]